MYIYLEPGDVLYFGGWTLQNKVFSNQNKGHLGSRYIIYLYISWKKHQWIVGKPKEIDGYVMLFFLFDWILPVNQTTDSDCFVWLAEVKIFPTGLTKENIVLVNRIQVCSRTPSLKLRHRRWKKSCTSWYVVCPTVYKVLYIPGGAGFLPSTVAPENWWFEDFILRRPILRVAMS